MRNWPTSARMMQQVADDRNSAIGGVELGESGERLPAMGGRTVLPGEALVPEKVVDNGGFDRERGCQQVVEMKRGTE